MQLSDFDHLRSDKRIKFKEEIVDGVSFTIIAYSISDTDLWKKPLALETRGITFNTLTGECVSRPFEKFFNLGENEWTQECDLDFTNMIVHEKRDGSMVHPVMVNGEVWLKTKKSFSSEVAQKANSCMPAWVENVSITCLAEGYTPIFEFTHPDHQIVLNYGTSPTFKLLAIRDNEDGTYVSQSTQLFIYPKAEHNPASVGRTIKELKENTQNLKNFEGYVLELSNGTRVKLKTRWYEQNHRIMTDLRERDIARMVVDENVDDLKASLVAEGKSIEPVLEIERRVINEMLDFVDSCYNLKELMRQEPTRKDAALKYGKEPLFGYAMTLYTGQELDMNKIFKNTMLSKYSLRVVYNPSFGEVE